jgi:hypothetical protein
MEAQTHARIFKKDMPLLKRFMKRRNIKSQAVALRKLLRR